MNININKIRDYNQLLLSIAGTILILFFTMGGLFIVYNILADYNSHCKDYQSGIIAQEEADQLLEDSIRKQMVSFNQINLIDSTNELFIIPVTQENLYIIESLDKPMGLINNYSGRGYHNTKNYDDGTFNNIVIFDAKMNNSDIIFQSRMSINSYRLHELEKMIYLLIIGTSKDSNNDKFLNSDDMQELFIYNLSKRKLTLIPINGNYSLLNIISPNRSKELFGRLGQDRNGDGKINLNEEPMVLKRIDVEESKLVNVLEDKQIEMLQKRLEGR